MNTSPQGTAPAVRLQAFYDDRARATLEACVSLLETLNRTDDLASQRVLCILNGLHSAIADLSGQSLTANLGDRNERR